VIAAALFAVLLQSPRRVIATNRISATTELTEFRRHATVCQGAERIPAGTEALRISAAAYIGPRISLVVRSGTQPVSRGHQASGWVSSSLTLPLRPALKTGAEATICLTRDSGRLAAGVLGGETLGGLPVATANGAPLSGRMQVEYLARGNRSWLSLAHYVARRIGLDHAPSGGWIVIVLVAITFGTVGLAGWLLLREAPDRASEGG
jgi:hypothetical protein